MAADATAPVIRVHDLTTRFGLRNRTQAVAWARNAEKLAPGLWEKIAGKRERAGALAR